jgi:class 3 adenylate cyclase/ABC-type branched-subunit amino acid transport system substrate-binding protein
VLEAFNAQLWYPASYEGLENCSQIFYTGFCANQQVELTINWLLRNQKTRCYLLGWDQVFSYTLNKLMKVHLKHYGGEVVGEAYLPSSTMDFEAIITRIRQAQPDIIINTLRGDRNLSFYRQFYESGIKASDLPILATSLSESEVQKLQEAAVGHFSCFHYFQSLNTPENHQFVQVFKRFYGEERVINNSMATAHTQIHLWKQAVELAESFDVERVKIAAYGQCFVSPGGLVRLEPNHHVAKVCRIGQVLPNQEFEVLYTSEKLIKPLPWLGFNEDNFNASGIVFELLSEVSQGIERAEQLEQKSIELEATKAQLQQEIETRKQFELALQKANEQLEKKVAERTAALKESNDNLVQEIVQHQRSENALRMATDQLQTVLEAVPGTVSWIDSDLCYIEVNQRLSNMLNLPRERFVGQHIGFLGTSSEFQDFVQDLFNSPEIDAYREVRNQVNGEWRHYLIVAQKYNHNQAAFVVGIDITDRKQAEESLRNAKNQLQTVLEAVPGTVSWINSDLRYIEVNQRLADMFGMPRETFIDQHIGFLGNHSGFTQFIEDLFNSYAIYKKIVTTNSEVLYSPTEELLGKTVFEVFPASHATLFYNQIQEVLNTKQTLNIEYSLVSAEYKPGHPGTNSSPLNPGDEVWFAAMVSPMPDNCVIWVARNTTERRRVLEALQAEREKSERLLLNILPPSIAEQLKQNQHSIAERFEQATIMFADIVDFTGFSARISPSELVNFLNQVFSAFDELAEKHHLEKIKTIGDSYMVAGGLPTPRHDHVEAMAEMALDMQAEIRRFQGQMGQSCNLRIGINTGPVVAGVIGTKKFIYDLWGDAVNIASRMESQGEVGKIQVTATTKNLLNGKYDFEERGLIDVKGRGEMLTYWLTKRRLV